MSGFTITQRFTPDILLIANQGNEVIRIDRDGRVFWKTREVETDDDFRAAMLELLDYMMGKRP